MLNEIISPSLPRELRSLRGTVHRVKALCVLSWTRVANKRDLLPRKYIALLSLHVAKYKTSFAKTSALWAANGLYRADNAFLALFSGYHPMYFNQSRHFVHARKPVKCSMQVLLTAHSFSSNFKNNLIESFFSRPTYYLALYIK